jgi:hypothetical protein
MNVKTNTILELEQAGRFSEAGYGRLFAYNSLHFNAKVDARTKAKFIRNLNPDTTADTQIDLLYSGPTVFFRSDIDIIDKFVDKLDLKSAYPAYLISDLIDKPGIFRIRHDGAFPLSERIALYIIKFNCQNDNLFVKWFLNSSAITQKKIKTDGSRVWGTVAVFSSTWMNLIKYVNKFLSTEEGVIIKSYTFHGSRTIDIQKSQIRKLYDMKEHGVSNAKSMLVQATGWLALIDRPTYYHMVQYVKYYLMSTVYDYNMADDLIGVQTDCIFYRVSERTETTYKDLTDPMVTLSNESSTLGTYKFQRVRSEEIIKNKARMVLKDGDQRELHAENTETD